jgi:hypothetical protein
VESTKTAPAPVATGRQEQQLIAGRYRLASLHRGDDSTEVWRALDESSHQVVSLEFLRDRDPVSRDRFIEAGHRMASVEQPSVMKVAAVHDDAEGTFIVFEHLVHIPVPLEWLKPKVLEPAPVLTTFASTTEPTPDVAPATPLPTTPIATVAAEDATAPQNDAKAGDRGLSLLIFALRSRELSLIDESLLRESANEFVTVVRATFEDVRLDPSFIADVQGLPGRAVSAITSAPGRFAAAARSRLTIRRRKRVPGPFLATERPARVPQVKAMKPPKQAAPPRVQAAPRTPRTSPRLGLRVRWGRVLTRGLSLGVLAAVLVALPSELLANVGNVANDLSTTIRERLAAATSGSSLQRASFEVPPLSAYGATFELQAPYPTTHPNETVEWVVALRNTGSAGWYRGIDGAQASLTLADGTSAGVQTTAYVGPGQIGWFVVHFTAPSEPGVSTVTLLPRIDGRGALPDLGIYATVTVSPNP